MGARKRRPTGEVAKVPARGSIVQIKVGTHTYDAVYVSSCHTCTHPARMHIEEMLLQNYAYRAIASKYSGRDIEFEGAIEKMPSVSYNSIRSHYLQGHMPMESTTIRRLAERRARQIGSRYEEKAEQFVDHYLLAETVVHKAYTGLVGGSIDIDLKDGLAAAKFLQEIEASSNGGLDSEAWSAAMTVYFETAQQIMPPEMWVEFTEALGKNPILRALQRSMDPNSDQDEVLDAELVE